MDFSVAEFVSHQTQASSVLHRKISTIYKPVHTQIALIS